MLASKALSASLSARPLPEFVSSSAQRNANTSSITVTAPAGIQNGDVLVALTYTGGAANITPPSGFLQIYNEQAANPQVTINTKIASSESGNYTFTLSTSRNTTAAILVYRNATFVNTIGDLNRASSTATATALTITPSYRGVLLSSFSNSANVSVSTPPSGMTQRVAPINFPTVAIYELSPQEATATGDKTLVWSGTGTVSGLNLQITNEPNVAPEFVASASTQTTSTAGDVLTIAKPTGTVEGDLMIASMAKDGIDGNWSPPAGWTEIADQTVSPELSVHYKVAGASEPSDYSFSGKGTGRHASGSILTYRYAAYDTIGSFTTGTNPLILPSISPSESQSILIAVGARAAANITLGTPTSMTARVTDDDATGPSYIVCDQTVAKAPTGTRSMSTGSTSNVAGIMLAIKPTRSL
jgi:hypothetical protein